MQQNNKVDYNSLIGFILMGAILVYFTYMQEPEEVPVVEEAKQEEVQKSNDFATETSNVEKTIEISDSLVDESQRLKYGEFYYTSTLEEANKTEEIVLENELIKLTFDRNGAKLTEAQLKEYKTYSQEDLLLVGGDNYKFDLEFSTVNNRTYNTENLLFVPSLTENGDSKTLSLKAKVSENKYLEYQYTLHKDEYMLDFNIRTINMSDVIATSKSARIDWELNVHRTEKSFKNENMYTTLDYEYEGGKTDYLSAAGSDDEIEKDLTWIAFKQQFFSMVILNSNGFPSASLSSESHDEFKDEVNHIQSDYTKSFKTKIPLEYTGNELNYALQMYIGPNKYNILSKYDKNLDELIPLGWGIFGWVNKYFVIPIFNFLEGFDFSYGIIILILTFIVKLLLSPVTYKNFLSSAKMRVIRPEIDELNEKNKNADAMKKQQATMELYKKAGVNPMSGCLPALLQMPILFAMFRFFPSAIELRQESFLWAEDLSSYDSILQLPFYIPFYGEHISLFTLLMAGALMIYTMMSGAGMNQPTQPGMPNMKYMMYLMPVMMIFFFNSYSSGLSYYYFLSNFIAIIQIIIIKKYIINEDKIHAQIQENKKKPVKKGKWAQRMDQMMKEQQNKAK
jgi:YidC/Oxa1 family membrane protein insertase